MSKNKILIIIISAVLLIAVGVTIALVSQPSPYDKQIKLAYKLLQEGKYEEAILAFDKAIEIDVKRDKAYIGKADVYIARGDENALEDVKTMLETAYNYHYDDENVIKAVMRMADDFMANGNSEWALELLEYGYELTGDERIKEYKAKIFDTFADGFLAELYKLFESGDKEGVRKEIQSEKYLNFAKVVDNSDYNYIYFPKANSSKTGKGVALYYTETQAYGNVFVYYGDYANGVRSGNGTWAGANGIQYYWFEGQWSDDKPNGEGILEIVRDESKIEKEEGHTYSIKSEIKGNFKNGKHHGSIDEKWLMDDGDVIEWTINSVDGIYQPMGNIPEEFADYEFDEGEYIVAVTAHESLSDDGSVHYILGFK